MDMDHTSPPAARKDKGTGDRLALFAYLAVCFFWGSTYLAIRIGVAEFPPALFAGFRFLIAGGIVLAYAAARGLPFPDKLRDWRGFSIVGLLLLWGGNGLVVYAEQWVHSGVASLVLATMPMFIALIEWRVFRNQRLSMLGWSGLLIGFSGVAWLVTSGGADGSVDLPGALILLSGCFLWSAGSVYSKTLKATGSVVTHIGIQMLAGGIALTVTGLLAGEAALLQPTARGLGAMAYLIVFGSLVGYSAYIYLLQKWPASKVGTYAYINPVVGVVLGHLVLGERLDGAVAVSTAVILAGVLLVQRAKIHQAK